MRKLIIVLCLFLVGCARYEQMPYKNILRTDDNLNIAASQMVGDSLRASMDGKSPSLIKKEYGDEKFSHNVYGFEGVYRENLDAFAQAD